MTPLGIKQHKHNTDSDRHGCTARIGATATSTRVAIQYDLGKKHTYPGRILQEMSRHGKIRRPSYTEMPRAREAMTVAVAFRPEAEP